MPRRRGGRGPPVRSRCHAQAHLPVRRACRRRPRRRRLHSTSASSRSGRRVSARRRGRRVLGLPDGDEAQHRVHQLQVALDLLQRLRRRTVLEEHVERPALLGDEIRELAQAPLLHLAHGPALLLDQRLDAGGQLLRCPARPAPDGSGRASHSGDPPCIASRSLVAVARGPASSLGPRPSPAPSAAGVSRWRALGRWPAPPASAPSPGFVLDRRRQHRDDGLRRVADRRHALGQRQVRDVDRVVDAERA